MKLKGQTIPPEFAKATAKISYSVQTTDSENGNVGIDASKLISFLPSITGGKTHSVDNTRKAGGNAYYVNFHPDNAKACNRAKFDYGIADDIAAQMKEHIGPLGSPPGALAATAEFSRQATDDVTLSGKFNILIASFGGGVEKKHIGTVTGQVGIPTLPPTTDSSDKKQGK